MESAELVQRAGSGGIDWRPPAALERDATASPVRGRATLPILAGVVALLSALAFGDPHVNGDSVWGLAWGEQLARGELESFGRGPTPHPLTVGLGALTAPLGLDAAYVVTYALFGPLALGCLAAAAFDLARRVSSSAWGGALVIALLLTSPMILRWSAQARYDIAFAALVLTAVALRLARPRTSLVPLGVLAVAGLIRPEAWVLAGALWLWQWRDLPPARRVAALGLAGLAPALWALMDLAVMGDPLYSLHYTDAASEKLYGQYTRAENLAEAARSLLLTTGPVTLLLAPVGLVAGWRGRRSEALAAAVVLAIALAIFFAFLVKGLASSERYLLLPACLLMLFAATACVARPGRRALVVAASALIMLQLAARADTPLETRETLRPSVERTRDVAELVALPGVRRMLHACPTVAVPTGRMLAEFVRQAERPAVRWTVDPKGTSRPDVFVAPASASAATAVLTRRRFDSDPTFTVPAGMLPGPSTRHWRIYVSGGAACGH